MAAKRQRWEYIVGHFGRRERELWFESSLHGRIAIRNGGPKGYAEILNSLGAEGWDLVHVDDTPERKILEAGDRSVYAWGDMIFKRAG